MISSARAAAGRRNRLLRKPLTDADRQRLRQAALRNRPWQFSTGPVTEEGKFIVAQNGRKRQQGTRSIRQARADVADVHGLIDQIAELRGGLEGS